MKLLLKTETKIKNDSPPKWTAFYGKLKKGLDGLTFQQKIRNEWN